MNKRVAVRMSPVQNLKTELTPRLWAQVVDISDHGAQIEVSSPLAPKSAFDLKFRINGQDLVLRAQVKRCRVWKSSPDLAGNRALLYRAGVEFTKPLPGLVKLLSSEITLRPAG